MQMLRKLLPVTFVLALLATAIGYQMNQRAFARDQAASAPEAQPASVKFAPLPVELWGRSWRARSADSN